LGEPGPQPAHLSLAHRALLGDPIGALGEDVEFAILRQKLDLHVTINEDFVTGLGGGTGTLYHQGQSYPFKLAVVDPGGGIAKINASGEVYKLASVADFPGRYTQSTGAAGLSTSGGSDLWLQNGAGVIMHRKKAPRG
jgi:hypothetical protein